MRYKFNCILAILLFTNGIAFNQEINQLKNYLSNSLYNINPAAAGYEGGFVSQVSYSKDWTGLPGSPECQVLSNSIRLGEEEFYDPKMFKTKPFINYSNHASLGFTLYNETEGPLQHTGFMAAYAYHISLNDARLSFGLAGLITQYHLNASEFNPVDPNDPELYSGSTAFIPDFNFGAMLYSRLFFLGVSANGLVNFNKTMDHVQTQPDVVLFGGNKFIVNYSISIEPSLFFWRYGQGSYTIEANAKMYFRDENWLLLAYHDNEIVAGIGIVLKQGLQLSYNYRINTNGLSGYTEGSQNLSLIANIAVLTRKHNYSW
jgi:type IX secretion system PorP/SprF family membrane protein